MLVSRFLLDLQHANRKTLHLDSGADSYADSDRGRGGVGGSIVFERVVGSIASSIEPGGYYYDEDDAEDEQGGDCREGGDEGRDSDADVEMRALEGHQGEESSSASVSGSGPDLGDGDLQFVVPATPPPLSRGP